MKTVIVLCFLLPLLLILSGCDTFTRKPTRFEVPIEVKCEAKSVPIPTFALDLLPLEASEPLLFDALVIERIQRIAYEIELVAAVRQCQ